MVSSSALSSDYVSPSNSSQSFDSVSSSSLSSSSSSFISSSNSVSSLSSQSNDNSSSSATFPSLILSTFLSPISGTVSDLSFSTSASSSGTAPADRENKEGRRVSNLSSRRGTNHQAPKQPVPKPPPVPMPPTTWIHFARQRHYELELRNRSVRLLRDEEKKQSASISIPYITSSNEKA